MRQVDVRKVSKIHTVSIPEEVRRHLNVGIGDQVGYFITDEGDVVVRKVEMVVR